MAIGIITAISNCQDRNIAMFTVRLALTHPDMKYLGCLLIIVPSLPRNLHIHLYSSFMSFPIRIFSLV